MPRFFATERPRGGATGPLLNLLLLPLALSAAFSAEAGTICIASCSPPPGGGSTTIIIGDPGPGVVLGETVTASIILDAGSAGGTFNVTGDLVVHVANSVLSATSVDIRALGDLTVGIRTIDVGLGVLSLCALMPSCSPHSNPTSTFDSSVIHALILGPISGPVEFFATGDIQFASLVVPEPTTGFLLALGLCAIAGSRSRVVTRKRLH